MFVCCLLCLVWLVFVEGCVEVCVLVVDLVFLWWLVIEVVY